MIKENATVCPKCGSQLGYYDSLRRIVRTKGRRTKHIVIHRYRCESCEAIHTEIPDIIFPYKQYEAEIIIGVVDGLITSETLGYEDYPCEMTMQRWRSQNLQSLL